jgi:8-hydroxy-5-deazaflavin:NADPH oxidoreductase
MTIAIIGSGAIGAALARTLVRAGIEAIISNSRGPDSLEELVRELAPSIKAGRAMGTRMSSRPEKSS